MTILIKNILLNNQTTDIFIDGNTFSKIEPNINIPADTVIDGSRKAILPAFYNTHTHAAMSVLKGLGDDKPLFDWLNQDIWPIEALLSPDDIYDATRLAILEMIKTGTVFFSDMYWFMEKSIQAVCEMGIRAAVSLVQFDLFDEEAARKKKEMALDFYNQQNPCPERIVKSISCHAVYTVSEDLFKWTAEFARKNDLFIHIHASETAKEVEDCFAKYGKSPIEKLEEWNLLGPKTILAHAIHLSEKDIEILNRHEVSLATNPASNMKLCSGLFKFEKLLKSRCNLTLGTDGSASNNNLSMLEEMKLCSLAAKIESMDASAGKAQDIFRIATRNGAQAFGLNAGIIEEKALADCILVDLDNVFLTPDYNLISNIVYASDSSCITDVICNGQILMRNRIIKDEKEIIKKAQGLSEKIRELKKKAQEEQKK